MDTCIVYNNTDTVNAYFIMSTTKSGIYNTFCHLN